MTLVKYLTHNRDEVYLSTHVVPLRNVARATENTDAIPKSQAVTKDTNGAIEGAQTISDTTQSTSKDTGALIVEGGVGVEKNLYVGGDINAVGSITGRLNVIDTGGAYAVPIQLTSAQSGSLILVDDAAGLDFLLPAIGTSDVGMVFEFLVTVTVTSNNFRVTAATGDLLNGGVNMVDFDAAYTAPQGAFLEPDFSDDLIMTCNGSTTGGKKGTRVKFEAISATQWFVSGTVAADGVIATPFS